MKGISIAVFATVAMLGLGLCSCKKASPLKTVWITHSTIKKISANKDARDSNEQKMSSAVLELFEQLKQNQSVDPNAGFDLPPTLAASEDLLQPSLAKVALGDSVLCYIFSEPSTAFTTFEQDIRGDGITIVSGSTHGHFVETWLNNNRKDKIIANHFYVIRNIALVTDPIQSSLPEVEGPVRSPNFIHVPDFPSLQGDKVMIGILSDDCGSTEGILSHNTYLQSSDCPLTSGLDNAIVRSHEGLAMMEIVKRIAPKSTVKFATATASSDPLGIGGMSTYRDNIIALSKAGCQIIADDIIYPEEAAFEDGEISYVMDSLAKANGTIFISAAGNLARNMYSFTFNPSVSNVSFGKGSSWVSATVDTNAGRKYNQDFDIAKGFGVDIMLQWDDPYDTSANDFDMYLVDKATNNIIAFSNNPQMGSNYHPYERLAYQWSPCWGTKGYKLYITRGKCTSDPALTNPTPRMKLLMRGRITGLGMPKAGSIFGHPTDSSVIACAAMDVGYPWLAEYFSSQGDSLLVNVHAPIGENGNRPYLERKLHKPDISALDNIATSVQGFFAFGGTSAAAPIAAGIAALILSNAPSTSLTGAEYMDFQKNLDTACIIFGSELPNDSLAGYGRADAFQGIAQWLSKKSTYFASFKNAPDGTAERVTIPAGTSTGKNRVFISVSFDNDGGTLPCVLSLQSRSGTSVMLHSSTAPKNPSVVFAAGMPDWTGGGNPYGCFKPEGTLPAANQFDGEWALVTTTPNIRIRKWGIVLK